MGYREDEAALAAEAQELQRRLAAVQAEIAPQHSALGRLLESDESRRDHWSREVERLRSQLHQAESALAAQKDAARRGSRRDLRLNDPFEWRTSQPASD